MKKTVILLAAAVMPFAVFAQSQSAPGWQAKLRQYEILAGNLIQHVKSMQDENAKLAADVAELKSRMAKIDSENRLLSNEVDRMRKLLAADSEARKSQIARIERLAKVLAAQSAQESRNAQQDRTGRSGEQQRGSAKTPKKGHEREQQEFVEHVVEQGTTLSALSKAYKVPVAEIKRFNRLTGNNIRVGQKLLIPVDPKR